MTSRRCDICSVGPSSMASVCMFILLVFSFLSMESKCSKSHVSSVRLQLGSWLIKMEKSWSWAVCEATVPVAISSKRGSKSVVSSGSGNSLKCCNMMWGSKMDWIQLVKICYENERWLHKMFVVVLVIHTVWIIWVSCMQSICQNRCRLSARGYYIVFSAVVVWF